MICYLDKTFCGSDCVNHQCDRNFTPEHRNRARLWWGKEGAPVAFADWSEECADYESPKSGESK